MLARLGFKAQAVTPLIQRCCGVAGIMPIAGSTRIIVILFFDKNPRMDRFGAAWWNSEIDQAEKLPIGQPTPVSGEALAAGSSRTNENPPAASGVRLTK